MKKLLFVCIALMIVTTFAPTVATAEFFDGSGTATNGANAKIAADVVSADIVSADVSDADVSNWTARDFVQNFLNDCPKRDTLAEQLTAASWLKDCFSALCGGLSLRNGSVSVDIQKLTNDGDNDPYGYNTVVRFDFNSAEKQVIVGAHYDSVGEGANDNASGVAAMFRAMQSVAVLLGNGEVLPFDLVFVAFGGEEDGLLGSDFYVNSMTKAQRDATLVMFNLDSVGGGDNLYVFCENKRTDLANLIVENAADGALTEKPYAQGVFAMDMFGYGYYEFIQGSDHTSFRLQGIPTATFFAGNYSGWNYVESVDTSKRVMNGSGDTLENMEKFWSDGSGDDAGALFYGKIETVAATISTTLFSQSFFSVAENARSQLVNNSVVFNTLWPTLVLVGLLGLCLLFAWFYYRKLQKRAILGTADAKEQPKVFTQPKAEDIFDFGDNDKL